MFSSFPPHYDHAWNTSTTKTQHRFSGCSVPWDTSEHTSEEKDNLVLDLKQPQGYRSQERQSPPDNLSYLGKKPGRNVNIAFLFNLLDE